MKKILIITCISLSFVISSKAQNQIDSLKGFNKQDAIHDILEQGIDSSQLNFALKQLRRSYINQKYHLGFYGPPKINQQDSSQSSIYGLNSIDCATGNWGFEDGNLTNWTSTGKVQVENSGTDPYGNYPWVYPNGGSYSVRISCDDAPWGGSNNQRNGELSRVINVPSTGVTLFTFHFAMSIYNYPHTAAQAGKLWVDFYDQNNNELPCPQYECYYSTDSGAVGVPNMQQTSQVASDYNPTEHGAGSYNVTYSDWNNVTLNLSQYAGQQLTVVFRVNWCIYNVDWAYALVDVDCPMNTGDTVQNCLNSSGVSNLCGPGNMNNYTYTWKDQNNNVLGHNICYAATQAGIYTLTCVPADIVCSNNQTSAFTFVYKVNPTPVQPIIQAHNLCLGDSIHLQDNSNQPSSVTWNWTIDSTNVGTGQTLDTVFQSPGTYNIQLKVGAGQCAADTTISVIVNPLPVPNFTSVPKCPNIPSQFNNTTPDANDDSYQWDFGDSSSGNSTQQDPSYAYDTGGVFTVKLIATSDSNCVDSVTHNITIPYLPIAGFTFDTVCVGNQTCFVDTSTVKNSTITQWTWLWGDSTPSGNTQNPCHLYDSSGTYTVVLKPVSGQGCVATSPAIHQVTVNSQPKANFTFANVCRYDSAMFTNTSILNTHNLWDFGDGDTSIEINPSHIYSAPGNYNVKLTATSSSGCSDDTVKQITIYPIPTANFNFINVCDNDTTTFTNNSTVDSSGTISAYNWNFGDGIGSSTQQSPSYLYGAAGLYNVKLTITTMDNCIDTITKLVKVYPNPIADFSSTQTCFGVATTFHDQTTVSSGNVNSWSWKFYDTPISTSNAQNPSYTFSNSGTFNVMLSVKTNHNCIDSVMKTITVNPKPDANFFSHNRVGCTPWCVKFTDSSSIESGSIVNWEWNVDVDSTLSGESVTYCYKNDGLSVDTYPISLTVISDKSCKDTITKNNYVTIYPRPRAAFTINPNPGDIYKNKISFTDESQGATVWNWNFGDPNGGTSTLENPTHTYKDSGNYIVYLKVFNQWGCSDSTSNPIRINPKFAIFIPNAFTPDGDGVNDYFYPKGYGIKEMSMYIFDRWGNMIYKGYQLTSKWNGELKGTLVPPDVYVYKIIVKDIFGNSHIYIGSVTVIR